MIFRSFYFLFLAMGKRGDDESWRALKTCWVSGRAGPPVQITLTCHFGLSNAKFPGGGKHRALSTVRLDRVRSMGTNNPLNENPQFLYRTIVTLTGDCWPSNFRGQLGPHRPCSDSETWPILHPACLPLRAKQEEDELGAEECNFTSTLMILLHKKKTKKTLCW